MPNNNPGNNIFKDSPKKSKPRKKPANIPATKQKTVALAIVVILSWTDIFDFVMV
jgi:hypothetical protein